jgi:hypothetical protein
MVACAPRARHRSVHVFEQVSSNTATSSASPANTEFLSLKYRIEQIPFARLVY